MSTPVSRSQPTTATLIERLRSPDIGWSGDAQAVDAATAAEAAERIELLEQSELNEVVSLRTQLASARKALEEIVTTPTAKDLDYDERGEIKSGSRAYGPGWSAWHFQNIARTALKDIPK